MKIDDVLGKGYTFVDVRSPAEFAEDHIPGAVNIPLFSNDERAIIGTMYKQIGKDVAINKGLEIVSQKLPEMIAEYTRLKGPLCVYCWRGGMRSGSVVSLLQSLKFDVAQLENGYKDYRRFVREQFETIPIPPMVVLYGLTGSGKTEMLQQLPQSLDLEGLAQHRGSIFGDVNLQPRTQKMFESLLFERLVALKDEPFIFVEGESRKIGMVIIPVSVWQAMQKGKKVRVVCSHEERVNRLYNEYCVDFDVEKMKEKIRAIQKFLGKKQAEELCAMLDRGQIRPVIEKILVEYYDRLYKHTVESKVYSATVSSVDGFRQSLPEAVQRMIGYKQ